MAQGTNQTSSNRAKWSRFRPRETDQMDKSERQSHSKKSMSEIQKEVQETMKNALPKIRLQSQSIKQRKELLNFMATQYQYSLRNLALIQSQYDGAMYVGSFNFWREKGFNVKKGEHAIKILTPREMITYYDDAQNQYLSYGKLSSSLKARVKAKDTTLKKRSITYFTLGNVFDITQTTAKVADYPEIFPNRPFQFASEHPERLNQTELVLKDIAAELGTPITSTTTTRYKSLKLGAAAGATIYVKGEPKEIVMKNGRDSSEYVATVIHELAHVKLHGLSNSKTSDYWNLNDVASPEYRGIKEFQAEMTSYVVSRALGIDTSERAEPYIAGWTEGLATIDGTEEKQQAALMSDVQRVSSELINQIQDGIGVNKERVNDSEMVAEDRRSQRDPGFDRPESSRG